MANLEQVLSVINRSELNITYLDARTDGLEAGVTQVGVFAEDPDDFTELLGSLRPFGVRLVPQKERAQFFDNNHFNMTFAHRLAQKLDLSLAEEEEILVNSNRIMQNLIRRESDPFHPFTAIYQAADSIASFDGDAFAAACRIKRFSTVKGLSFVSIEPPVGSDTWILECADRLLCIDAGYACFANELEGVLRTLYPDWDERRKELVLTHGDIDHVGACALFDRVYALGHVIDNFEYESLKVANWREQSPLMFPFIRIACILSGYQTPDFRSMEHLGASDPVGVQEELFRRVDTLEVAPLCFEVWEGKGGHVRGETVLIERTHRLCVSGDIFVNVHDEIKPQARFNELGPYLAASVDMVPDLAKEERKALFGLLGEGTWQVLCGHGAPYLWESPDQ